MKSTTTFPSVAWPILPSRHSVREFPFAPATYVPTAPRGREFLEVEVGRPLPNSGYWQRHLHGLLPRASTTS